MGKHQYRKEVRELVDFALKLGFEDLGIIGSGHVLLRHGNGSVTLSATPSRRSSALNAKAQIRAVAQGRHLNK